jgi:hypothetical protein
MQCGETGMGIAGVADNSIISRPFFETRGQAVSLNSRQATELTGARRLLARGGLTLWV